MSPNAPLGAAMLHAALLMLMLVGLAIFVINRRRTAGVGLGDGGNKALAKAVRAHGNFTEYAPFAIAAYVLLALSGVSAVFIHVLGTVFIVGRVAHAAGLSQHEGASVGRTIGAAATMIVLIAASLRLLMGALG
ncbi:MAG: MAPEG family protein [Hyphomicrobiales bacterium]|nr:MAPEG family protein [Hyphomicrobiales bacterium]